MIQETNKMYTNHVENVENVEKLKLVCKVCLKICGSMKNSIQLIKYHLNLNKIYSINIPG